MKTIISLGAGGFIGSHLVSALRKKNHFIIGADIKKPLYKNSEADMFLVGDLIDKNFVLDVFKQSTTTKVDEVYQLAADMGGAQYIFSGLNDADVMSNSAKINLNTAEACLNYRPNRIFFSSSACVYPEHNQLDPNNPNCEESSAYPANPDSEYGWEKIFSERLYLSYNRNHNLNVKIARFHNIFGPCGTWKGGKEKAPAAICRKVAEAKNGGEIEVWGDGSQTRSFLYIDECLKAVLEFTRQDHFTGPVNIGSEEKVSINELAQRVIKISGKNIKIKNLEGKEFFDKYGYECPLGVNGRNSHNKLFKEKIGWEPKFSLEEGLRKTYNWISSQI